MPALGGAAKEETETGCAEDASGLGGKGFQWPQGRGVLTAARDRAAGVRAAWGGSTLVEEIGSGDHRPARNMAPRIEWVAPNKDPWRTCHLLPSAPLFLHVPGDPPTASVTARGTPIGRGESAGPGRWRPGCEGRRRRPPGPRAASTGCAFLRRKSFFSAAAAALGGLGPEPPASPARPPPARRRPEEARALRCGKGRVGGARPPRAAAAAAAAGSGQRAAGRAGSAGTSLSGSEWERGRCLPLASVK